MYVSNRLTRVGTLESGAQDSALVGAARARDIDRARLHAVSILDGVMLLVAAALSQATTAATDVPAATGVQLVLFSLLCFALYACSSELLGAGGRTVLDFFSVPLLTGASAAALALAQAPSVGADAAALESLRPWLLATAYVLAGRVAFAWATTDLDAGVVADAIDRAAKRAFDVTLTSALLVFCAPVILLVALAITLEDRGPVFFRCLRVGEGGHELRMLKFRKMRLDAGGPPLTASDDDRFTRVGRFLASSKLDELPQLWNVLCGEMSLVGPRPEDPSFVAMHRDAFDEILWSKPGLTGLCQLAFAKENRILNPQDLVRDYVERLLPQKIDIDLLYARRRTFFFDAKILVWTLVAVLLRKDVAVNRETGDLTLRRRRPPDSAPGVV